MRVAVVGCGAVARRHHVPALTANPDVEVALLCDPAEEPAQLIRNRFRLSCPIVKEFDEVLADRSIDAVHVCTPSLTHYEYAFRALDAGKHVLLEKPPVYDVEHAERLIRLADERGVKLGVVFNNRYRDQFQTVIAARDRGYLGCIAKVQIIHHANLVFGESPWLWDERRSKYLIYEFGIHLFDLLVYFCGEHDKILSAIPTYQESVKTTSDLQVVIRFKSGAIATVDLTQDSTRHSGFFTHMYVFGTATDAFIRLFPPLVRFTSGQGSPQDWLFAEIRSLWQFTWLLATGRFLKKRNAPHQRVIDMYVDWLVNDTPYPLTMTAALPTIRLLNDLEQHIPSYRSSSEEIAAPVNS